MSKIVNVVSGDYKIKVTDSQRITLDVGPGNQGTGAGAVHITGDLIVQGTTTTINTEELTIEDRVLTIAKTIDITADDPQNPQYGGIQTDPTWGRFAGIEIERGSFPDAFVGFDEDIDWINPTARSGAFIFKDQNDSLLGIRTNSITTGAGDLHLISQGNGITEKPVVTVTGVTNYEQNVFQYTAGALTGTVLKPDALTNAQSLIDWVDYNFANVFLRQIGDGTQTISSIEIDDEENTGQRSVITFKIDNNVVAAVYDDSFEFDEIRISGTTIETISTGDSDLTLRANGTGSIRIDDMLHINSTPSDDDTTLFPGFAPDEGVKLYVNNQYSGKTGIYFINAENNRDELVSKNRALLFGMLF
tara:strand:- start:1479 stop:2561 length:1083 start_codon:yes stop_codon:yes gene_type:complete